MESNEPVTYRVPSGVKLSIHVSNQIISVAWTDTMTFNNQVMIPNLEYPFRFHDEDLVAIWDGDSKITIRRC